MNQSWSQASSQMSHFRVLETVATQFPRFLRRVKKSLATCLASSTRVIVLACIASVCVLGLTGCTSMKDRLGWKVYLAKTPVASMDAKLLNGPGIAPGKKSSLVVSVTEPNGKVLLTEGKGGGKVTWKDLQVSGKVVTVNQKGVVSLAKDPRVSDGKTGHVTVTVPSHPDLQADLDIPFRYDIAFVCNFSGSTGASGTNGMDGTDGASGSPGSTDLNNPSPGGNGGNGTDGTDGSDGSRGGDAPPVLVRVTLQNGPHPLMQVSGRSWEKAVLSG